MSETLPEVAVSPVRKAFFSGASVIWVVPILALLVALGVAWQSYNNRGPLIEVQFQNGAGISAGETQLKYRDVTVGLVEKVGFTKGLSQVVASIRVDKGVAPYIDSSAVFWIVQPEVTAQGITGLSTVLSGVHIEGSWDDVPGSAAESFHGASEPPLIRPGQSGLEIAFRTVANGQLTDNAPILYKGIEVGRVGRAKIAPQGNYAIVEALIYDDHRNLINQSTRFWDASGFSVSIGPSGAEIDFSSLATLIGGGVTFDTFVSGGNRVSDGTVFEIFPNKEAARDSLFNASEVDPLKLSVIFDDNISGLVVGAPVEMSGLAIGEVESLAGIVDYNQFGDSRVRLNVILSIQPARLGLPDEVSAANALKLLQERVSAGLRARLASASLLTGGLKVELVMVDGAPPAQVLTVGENLPVLPTTKSEVSDAAATVEGVFTRINNLPIEALLNSAISFLNSAEALVSNEDLRETPQDVRLLLNEVQGLIASDEVRNIPVALNATLVRVEGLVAKLEEERLAERLLAAIDSAGAAADTITASVDEVPALIEQIKAVAAKAETLPIEELVTELTALTKSADAVISSEDTVALPGSLKRALDEVQALIASDEVRNIPVTLNSTLVKVEGVVAKLEQERLAERLLAAIDSAGAAADSVSTSVDGVPALIEQIKAVAAKAETLPIEELVTELTALTKSADAVISSEDTVALPGSLKRALDEVQALIASEEVRNIPVALNQTLAQTGALFAKLEQERLAERLLTAVDSAAAAADSVTSSVAGVPALVDEIQLLAAKAQTLPVEDLIGELTALTRSADAVIGTEDAVALPGSLKRALDELNQTLQELRDGGAIENVNSTLASARNAADSIAVSAQDLPQIVERLTALFAQAGRTIEGYNKGNELSRSAQDTMRDIQKAADALASLARTIERNPNSLLLGR